MPRKKATPEILRNDDGEILPMDANGNPVAPVASLAHPMASQREAALMTRKPTDDRPRRRGQGATRP